MRRLLVLLLVLAGASRAAAWDSRCYLPGGAECFFGPATARSRWIGPSDEHRALLEFGRIFGGLPSSTSEAFTLPVFTSDEQVNVVFSAGLPPPPFDAGPPPPALPVTSLKPVNFIDAKRAQSRTMSFPEFAQLPDHAYSLWDWALGNETCPLGGNTDAVPCHEFKSHMGPVNSNHFPPQSAFFYEYYHRLALDRAADCKTMTTRLGDARARFAEFPVACEREALVLEAVGQHFLQDAWASGHMWERWGSPDVADFPSLTRALLVAMTSGLIHGARAVLEDLPPEAVALLGTTEYHFDDPLNAPDPRVAFRGPADLIPQAGVGDLYLTDLIAQEGAGFPAEYDRLFSCEAAGLRAVYLAAGEPEGALGPLARRPLRGRSDVRRIVLRPARDERGDGEGDRTRLLDSRMARPSGSSSTRSPPPTSCPILSTQAGGHPTLADLAQYQVDMAHIVAIARLTAQQDPNGVTLASGGLPPLLGIESNGFFVKSPLAAYVDPPLPWPAPGGTGAGCRPRAPRSPAPSTAPTRSTGATRSTTADAQQLDVAAFADEIEALQDEGGPELDALCAMCEEFASAPSPRRHRRRRLRSGARATLSLHRRRRGERAVRVSVRDGERLDPRARR